MAYFCFGPNAFTCMPNMELYPSYQPQLSNFIVSPPRQYYDFTQWNQPSSNENYSIIEQKMSIEQFAAT